jgi:hypothetical protein
MARRTIVIAVVGTLALSSAPAEAKSPDRTIVIKARSEIDRVQVVDNAP